MQTLGCMLFTVSCGWQYADESLRFVGFLFRLLKVFSTRCQFFFLVFVLAYFVLFLFCFFFFEDKIFGLYYSNLLNIAGKQLFTCDT